MFLRQRIIIRDIVFYVTRVALEGKEAINVYFTTKLRDLMSLITSQACRVYNTRKQQHTSVLPLADAAHLVTETSVTKWSAHVTRMCRSECMDLVFFVAVLDAKNAMAIE
jgi:hypothetical protein